MEFRRRIVIPFLLLILCLFGASPLLAGISGYSTFLDTTPIDTPEIPESIPGRKFRKASFDSEVKYSATDSIKIRLKEKKITLYGSAIVLYKDLEIRANEISIDFDTYIMDAQPSVDTNGVKKGIPFFKDDQNEMNAQRIRYNFKTKEGVIYELSTEEADGYVYGDKVKKDPFNNMYIFKARYTTCQDTTHPHFYIQAEKMKIIPGKKIVSGPALLYVGDVPTPGFLPFGFFPITKGRSSGIIIPSYGYSRTRGYLLRNGGYYFGINDYIDAALTGDIYANLSYRINATSHYAKRYRYSGNFTIDYAVNKDNEREDPDYSENKATFFTWTHRLDPKAKPNTSFNANVQLGSSNFLRQNSYNPNDIVRNTLVSSVSYGRNFGWSNLTLSGNHDQNTQTGNVNVTLPNASFDVNRFFPFRGKNAAGANSKMWQDIGVAYSTAFQNRLNVGDSVFFDPSSLDKLQYGLRHTLSASVNRRVLNYFNFTPSMNYSEFWYLRTIEKVWNPDSLEVETNEVNGFQRGFTYGFNASLNTQVFGMYTFKEGLGLKAIRHQMTPEVNFSYRPDFGQSKFGFYRNVQSDSAGEQITPYSIFENGIFGGPGRGKSGLVGFSLGNNLEMKVRDASDTLEGARKIKLIESIRFSTTYNILADSLNWSPLQVNMQTVLFKQFTVQWDMTYNPYALDSVGRTIQKWQYNVDGKLFRRTFSNFTVSTSLNAETFKGKATPGRVRPTRNPYMDSEELAYLNNPGNFVDFTIPWNLNFTYIYRIDKPTFDQDRVQTVNFSGDVSLTPKWKIGMSSGYNFTNKTVSYTSIDLYRDLHCWEFRFNWMPFGERTSFLFTINAKSSVLQDLKLNRRRDWFDR